MTGVQRVVGRVLTDADLQEVKLLRGNTPAFIRTALAKEQEIPEENVKDKLQIRGYVETLKQIHEDTLAEVQLPSLVAAT